MLHSIPPSGIATELTVRICTIGEYKHKSFLTDTAGHIRAGEGILPPATFRGNVPGL
jgi:hypothetical protein